MMGCGQIFARASARIRYFRPYLLFSSSYATECKTSWGRAFRHGKACACTVISVFLSAVQYEAVRTYTVISVLGAYSCSSCSLSLASPNAFAGEAKY